MVYYRSDYESSHTAHIYFVQKALESEIKYPFYVVRYKESAYCYRFVPKSRERFQIIPYSAIFERGHFCNSFMLKMQFHLQWLSKLLICCPSLEYSIFHCSFACATAIFCFVCLLYRCSECCDGIVLPNFMLACCKTSVP